MTTIRDTMTGYHRLISDATGVTDHALLNDIEEIMRSENGGVLDDLGIVQFQSLARQAAVVAQQMWNENREVG